MLRSICAAAAAAMLFTASPAAADRKLLEEVVDFTGSILFVELKVPGLVLGVVKDGDIVVSGFGEHRDGSGTPPDGDTQMRVGSITKVFTGAALASLAADGTVKLTDRLDAHLDWDVEMPLRNGLPIRLIHLATHTSGLKREVDREPGPPDDPFSTVTREVMAQNLAADPLLFAPGTSALYSNFGFDLLAQAVAGAADRPYPELLQERVLAPAGLESTGFAATPGRALMQGHGFEGEPLPDVPTSGLVQGAGGLFSSANDMLRWVDWHLERFADEQAAMRLIDHAAYVPRDTLDVVFGLDESGRMDAMGLGWITMYAKDGRPTILQKAGGLQGMLSYVAFAPGQRIGAFVAINKFDFGAATTMAEMVNDLIADLASDSPAVPAAPAAVAAGTEEAERDSVSFSCDDLGSVEARFGDDDVQLTLPGEGDVRLQRLLSGSGARYGNEAIEFWIKGDEATLTSTTDAGAVEHACRVSGDSQ